MTFGYIGPNEHSEHGRPVDKSRRRHARRLAKMDEKLQGLLRKMRKHNAFTLIELLVVISIIVLLMAILLPTLQRIRRQGKAVVCQSNLRQWAVTFSMYANDNQGALPSLTTIGPRVWPQRLRTYCTDSNDLLLCPMATRWEIRPDNPYTVSDLSTWLRVVGSKSTAWEYRYTVLGQVVLTDLSGSYGANRGADWSRIDRPYPGSGLNNVPVLLDCIYVEGDPHFSDDPPEYEGHIGRRPGDMTYFCINRHDGGVNGLFLDWSVRKIGLKELWTLRWDPTDSARMLTHSPWTKAGYVQPEDWPKWMRRFKDY